MAEAGQPETGRIEAGVHRFPLRVYYEDTDAIGVVYHANHLRYAERARTEMLRCLGLDHGGLRARFGLTFAVRRVVVDHRGPARLDDTLEVRTRILRVGGASLDLEQRIWRGDRLLVDVSVRLALLDRAQKVARLPVPLREALDHLARAQGPIG
jgi:acyl-CoA thioester hydrolase